MWRWNTSAILQSWATGVVQESVNQLGEMEGNLVRKGLTQDEVRAMADASGDIPAGKGLRCRLRYFMDGAVIGSRGFVNEAFRAVRGRFGARRKDGARKMRGGGEAWSGKLWSLGDLRDGV